MKEKIYVYHCEHCIMCGKEIPEGRQVCFECESEVSSFQRKKEETPVYPSCESFLTRFFKRRKGGE